MTECQICGCYKHANRHCSGCGSIPAGDYGHIDITTGVLIARACGVRFARMPYAKPVAGYVQRAGVLNRATEN